MQPLDSNTVTYRRNLVYNPTSRKTTPRPKEESWTSFDT